MSATAKQPLGKDEILEQIGRGAHATVYKARDTSLDRIVALKVMRPGLLWDPDAVERRLLACGRGGVLPKDGLFILVSTPVEADNR